MVTLSVDDQQEITELMKTMLTRIDPEKQGHLRQFIMDMRKCLAEIDCEYIVKKKYGKIGIDIEALQYEGNPDEINDEFCWL